MLCCCAKMTIEIMKQGWKDHIGKRLLVTDRITHIARNEWTLLEISPNGKVAKFRNELADCLFWNDLDDLLVVDILPKNLSHENRN